MPSAAGRLTLTGVVFRLGAPSSPADSAVCSQPLALPGFAKADTQGERDAGKRLPDCRLKAVVTDADAPSLAVDVLGLPSAAAPGPPAAALAAAAADPHDEVGPVPGALPAVEGQVLRLLLRVQNRSARRVARLTVAAPAAAAGVDGPCGPIRAAEAMAAAHGSDDAEVLRDDHGLLHARRPRPAAPVWVAPVRALGAAHAAPLGPSGAVFDLPLPDGGLAPGGSVALPLLVRVGTLPGSSAAHGTARLRLLLSAALEPPAPDAAAAAAPSASAGASARLRARRAPPPLLARWSATFAVRPGPRQAAAVHASSPLDGAPARRLLLGLRGASAGASVLAAVLSDSCWHWAPGASAAAALASGLVVAPADLSAADVTSAALPGGAATGPPAGATAAGRPVTSSTGPDAPDDLAVSEAVGARLALALPAAGGAGSGAEAAAADEAAPLGAALMALVRQEAAATSFAAACRAFHAQERRDRRDAATGGAAPRSLQEIRVENQRLAAEARMLEQYAELEGGGRARGALEAVLDDVSAQPSETLDGRVTVAGSAAGSAASLVRHGPSGDSFTASSVWTLPSGETGLSSGRGIQVTPELAAEAAGGPAAAGPRVVLELSAAAPTVARGAPIEVRVTARCAGTDQGAESRVRLGVQRTTAAAAGARMLGGQVLSVSRLLSGDEAATTVRLALARPGTWDLSSVLVARAEAWPPAADSEKPDRGLAVPVVFGGRCLVTVV